MIQKSTAPLIYDATSIGARAGGLSAAARATAAGQKVLVDESRDRVDGRPSREQIDDFAGNVGAIAMADAVEDYGDGGTQLCAYTAWVAATNALGLLGLGA